MLLKIILELKKKQKENKMETKVKVVNELIECEINGNKLYIPIEEFKKAFEKSVIAEREIEAIWGVYQKEQKKNLDCTRGLSDTCKDYGLDYSSKASSIMYIIEDYYKIKKENKMDITGTVVNGKIKDVSSKITDSRLLYFTEYIAKKLNLSHSYTYEYEYGYVVEISDFKNTGDYNKVIKCLEIINNFKDYKTVVIKNGFWSNDKYESVSLTTEELEEEILDIKNRIDNVIEDKIFLNRKTDVNELFERILK
jgi:hypothetical protein